MVNHESHTKAGCDINFVPNFIFMPPTLKKLMGHIAFGACVSGCVTLFVPTVTFKPLKE